MKPTDFARSLQKFFQEHLVHQRGSSGNTIKSYRDTFKIFLNYMSQTRSTPVNTISLDHFTVDEIALFRKYLATTRKNSERTKNQRMAVIHSFVNFLQHEYPDKMVQWQRIQAMPVQHCPSGPVKSLTQKEIAALMGGISIKTPKGLRDKAMLLLLYDSGARVQEIADLTVRDIRLDAPAQATLTGKGKVTRIVPLMPTTVEVLSEYLGKFGLKEMAMADMPLFQNRQRMKLTRFGITYLLKKYGELAKKQEKGIPSDLSPHLLRHSKAMHLLEQGVSIVVIQHILGHADLTTTSIYVKANLEMTRSALEKVNSSDQKAVEEYSWQKDDALMSMLDNL